MGKVVKELVNISGHDEQLDSDPRFTISNDSKSDHNRIYWISLESSFSRRRIDWQHYNVADRLICYYLISYYLITSQLPISQKDFSNPCNAGQHQRRGLAHSWRGPCLPKCQPYLRRYHTLRLWNRQVIGHFQMPHWSFLPEQQSLFQPKPLDVSGEW